MTNDALVETTARFLSPQFLALFKGFTFTTVIPIVIIVVFTVIVVNIIASLVADSPGPYPQFGKRVAVAAADLWDNRHRYGFLSGRTLEDLGPLEEVFNGISEAVKKWEDAPLYSAKGASVGTAGPNHLQQQFAANSAPITFAQPSPQFITNSLKHSSGKVRFQ